MNKDNIMKDLKTLMSGYISETAIDNFINDLATESFTNSRTSTGVDHENSQLEYKLPNGIDYRLLVDRCVTKCSSLLPEEQFYKLMLGFSKIIHASGENDLSLELTQEILNRIGAAENYNLIRAEVCLMISKIYWSQAYWDDCRYYVDEAMKIYNLMSDQQGIAKCENMLGTLYGEQGEIQFAAEHFENALANLSDTDDTLYYSMVLTNLGIIYTITGNYEKAIWNYKNSVLKFKMMNDTRCLSRTYHNIGMLYIKMEKFDAALDELNKCITISLDNNFLSNCAVAYIGKAYIYTKLKNSALADAYTDKALEISYRINDSLSIADIYKIKGMILNDLENFQLSEEMFENSIRLNRDFNDKLNEAECSVEMSSLLRHNNRIDEADLYFQSALNYFKGLKNNNIIAGLIERIN